MEREDLARLPVDFVFGPFRRVEKVLVMGPMRFPVEEKIGAMIMSFDDGFGMLAEGHVDAFVCFPRAFIFERNPEVVAGEHQHIRSVIRRRQGNVAIPDDFEVAGQPVKDQLLHGQVVAQRGVADQAGGGGAGVRNIAPGFVQKGSARAGEHVILLVVVMVMGKPLHEPIVAKRAKEFVGRVARQAEASGQESKGGKPKFPEPVQDELLLFSADGSGIFECGITVDNTHATTSFPSV